MNWRPLVVGVILLVIALLSMVGYGFYLKHQAEEIQARRADSKPIIAPVAGPTKHIIFFVPDDTSATLRRQEMTTIVPTESASRARAVLRAFVAGCQEKSSTHPMVQEGVDIKDVYIVGGNTAVVDTTAAFADQHRSGILVEQLTLAAMARTLGANIPAITRMKILVDGKERKTLAGHAGLAGFYELSLPDFPTQ